jgi:hypothetical protein
LHDPLSIPKRQAKGHLRTALKRSLFGGSTPFFSDKSREKWGRNPFSFAAVSKGRRTGAQNLSLPSRRAKRFHFTLWAE